MIYTIEEVTGMKVLVMSDTHGDAEIIERVKSFHPDVDAVIHCGDSELPYDHPYLEGVERVAGNCDHDINYLDEILFRVGDERIYVTHGHLYDVKNSVLRLTYRAQEIGANIVCFGHSHILGAELIDGTLFVNPGSLKKPRRIEDKSFVIIDIKEYAYILYCYNENNELIEKIHYER